MDQSADLVLLEDSKLNEDGVFGTLSSRLEGGKIYTYIGEVLISLNPYKQLPIYGKALIDSYDGASYIANPPHVYAVAEKMYRNLRDRTEDQCVLISGESGAGKTEASKKIMEYVAAVSRTGGAVGRVAGMLLGSNPILEAFGNAKTLRNDNSSRFGKYMEIIFDYRAVPFGGKVTNYLLEKVRVVQRAVDERSFHIFYLLLAGIKENELQSLGLKRDPSLYKYLACSKCYTVEGMNDKQEFDRVQNAMKVLGFSADLQLSTWRTLAGILLLGNVEFDAVGEGHGDSSKVTDPELVKLIANVWRMSEDTLMSALCTRTFATAAGNKQTLRKGGVNSPLSVSAAADARDALAKALYSGLFDMICAQLNKSMAAPDALEKRLVLGILDIYGFEIFDINSFEQFCINWCNEKLQQYFIELTLKSEQEEYAREGIQWTPIEYFNNQVICDLIENLPGKAGDKNAQKAGLVALLNEQCVLKNADDENFLSAISKEHAESPHFEVPGMGKGRPTAFTVKHYAGNVTYSVKGFIDKNTDTLFSDQRKLVESSADPAIKTLMRSVATDDLKRPDTAGTKFRLSLRELIEKLGQCRPSYIRCIKPNDRKAALTVDETRLRHQIRYLGLMENIRVMRAGFCNRQPYDDFLARYKMLVPRKEANSTWPHWKKDAKAGCERIIKFLGWKPEHYQMGKTKVFIRKPKELFQLENARLAALPMVATMIQSAHRGHCARVYWRHAHAALTMQKRWRAYKQQRKLVQLKALSVISSNIRGYWMRTHLAKSKCALLVQACVRHKQIAAHYARMRCAFLVQACVRQMEAAKNFLRLKQIVLIQAAAKSRLEQRKFTNAAAAFRIQDLFRAKMARRHLKEQLSGTMIKRNMRQYSRGKWLKAMIALYADAKRENQWGRGCRKKWPAPDPTWLPKPHMGHMEETWRYRHLLGSIKGREVLYRDKVLAYDTFRGNKYWQPDAIWGDHNYLGSELNPTRGEFEVALQPLVHKKIYFSDLVDKMNPNGTMVERAILITDQGFYRMTPGKYQADKCNPLTDIVKISLSKRGDHLVTLHHATTRDSVINGRAYIGTPAKPQLRRTRSFSDIGGKHANLLDAPAAAAASPAVASTQKAEGRSRSNSVAGARSRTSSSSNVVLPDLLTDSRSPAAVAAASVPGVVASATREGDDAFERYSELVVAILKACRENGVKPPEIVFSNVIEVNVAKKGEKKMLVIHAEESTQYLNSHWLKGKKDTCHVYSVSIKK